MIWSGRKWLGRQDSNLGSRDQNPLPYRLATPHQGLAMLPTVGEDEEERHKGENADEDDRRPEDDERQNRRDHREEL